MRKKRTNIDSIKKVFRYHQVFESQISHLIVLKDTIRKNTEIEYDESNNLNGVLVEQGVPNKGDLE